MEKESNGRLMMLSIQHMAHRSGFYIDLSRSGSREAICCPENHGSREYNPSGL